MDFSYEVSRSLAACEGALLVVDASQGVEAQSVANCYTAIEQGLEVLPVINKIDLPSADPDRVITEIEEIIGIDATDARARQRQDRRGRAGAARGDRPPHSRRRKGDPAAPLQALIVDSWFDNYVGVVSLVRVVNGTLRRGEKIRVMSTGRSHKVDKLGRFTPKSMALEIAERRAKSDSSSPASGRSTARRSATPSRSDARPCEAPLPGFKQIQPRVFAGVFPVNSEDYENFRDALAKLKLNDSALHYEPEVSTALGFGFRCGFLGLLHMDIVQERLEREYSLELITSAPTVVYEVARTDGAVTYVDNPAKLPVSNEISEIREPIITASILVPPDYVGAVLGLCSEKRGVQKKMQFLASAVSLQYDLPLAEVVLDFFDRLKSASRGYASFDYEFSHFQAAPLVKLDILINGDTVDALSIIVHKDNAYARGRDLVDKMQELIPRQMFEVAVQAAIGSHIIARATVKALRKNVLAKCYGGDIYAQAQAAGEAEGRQEAHEAGGAGRDSAGSVPGGTQSGSQMTQLLSTLLPVLAWAAIPVTLIAVIDDWFLRPRRRLAQGRAEVPGSAAHAAASTCCCPWC